MKKLSILVLAVLFSLSTNAQDSTSQRKYAISFGIGENFNLSKFQMDLAVKRVFEDSQLRLFISPQISVRDNEDDYLDSVKYSNSESNNYGLGVGADYLWNILRYDDFQLYGGPGLIVSYFYGKETINSVQSTNISMSLENISRSYRAGLRGILGVEWFVSRTVGIHSEYLFTLSYTSTKYDLKDTHNDITAGRVSKAKVIALGSTVIFGLSVYF